MTVMTLSKSGSGTPPGVENPLYTRRFAPLNPGKPSLWPWRPQCLRGPPTLRLHVYHIVVQYGLYREQASFKVFEGNS
jgi:hypothetical protein